RPRKLLERELGVLTRLTDVPAESRGDLVVTRPSGVNLATDIAEQPLDRRVDVLVRFRDVVNGDQSEPFVHLIELFGREQSSITEAFRVQCRRVEVVREQLRVVRAQE